MAPALLEDEEGDIDMELLSGIAEILVADDANNFPSLFFLGPRLRPPPDAGGLGLPELPEDPEILLAFNRSKLLPGSKAAAKRECSTSDFFLPGFGPRFLGSFFRCSTSILFLIEASLNLYLSFIFC